MIAELLLPGDVTFFAGVIALGVLTMCLGLYVAVVPHPVEQRLAAFVGSYGVVPARPTLDPRTSPELLAGLNRRLLRRRQSQSTRMLLLRANVSMTVAELLILRLGAAFVVGGVVALLTTRTLGLVGLALSVLAAIAGSYVPLSYVRLRASRRLAAIEAQLPDAIDLIASSLEAGGGMAQAFAMIAREMPPPMSEEFQRVNREVEVGLSYTEALTNLVDRLGSEDLDLVATTIIIQARVGGNLVQILRTINHTIRERIRIRGEVKVLTAMQRMSAIVITIIPPALAFILYLLNPRYVGRLFEPGIGQVMLITSVIMMVVGALILRKMTDIDY